MPFALLLTACGADKAPAPTFFAEKIPVYAPTSAVSPDEIRNVLDGFKYVTADAAPGVKLNTAPLRIFVAAAPFSAAECGAPTGCWGYTEFRGATIDVHVALTDDGCFSNGPLGHELAHVALQQSTGNADMPHASPLWWGWNGIVDAIKVDVGVVCAAGADVNKT